MTSMAFQVATPAAGQSKPAGAEGALTKGGDAATGFAMLMQGQFPAEGAKMAPLMAPLATDGAAEGIATLPEGIDPDSAEGLVALMEHVVGLLENEGGAITPQKVMKAFAAALGEAPAESFADLDAVIAVADDTLAPALAERMTAALRSLPHPAQLGLASGEVPAVSRAELRNSARPINLNENAVGPQTGPMQQGAAPQNAQAVQNGPATPAASAASAASAAIAPAFAAQVDAAAPRELPPVTALQAQLPPDLARAAPANAVAAGAQAPTTADDQLRRHVSQQIRSVDLKDNKFRFSLAPHGLGEIEIEVLRNEAGRVQIAMAAESASVLGALRQDRDQLLDALQARGILADNADLDFQTFGERDRNGAQEFGAENAAGAQAEAETAETEEIARVHVPTAGATLDIVT